MIGLGLEIHQEFGIFLILKQGEKVQLRLCLRTIIMLLGEGGTTKRIIFAILLSPKVMQLQFCILSIY